jgi:hypothetical protein
LTPFRVFQECKDTQLFHSAKCFFKSSENLFPGSRTVVNL